MSDSLVECAAALKVLEQTLRRLRWKPVLFTPLLILASLSSTSCVVLKAIIPSPPLRVPGYVVQPPPDLSSGMFRAGVARVEITPPPGYPTGGDGMAGGVARGYSMRLWVRTFYLADGHGHQVVLGSVDLYMLPGALHDLVAGRVKDRGIAPGEIVLSATHTHQGPGNFGSASVFNEFTSRESGFDRRLLDFLVERVARSVNEAIDDAKNFPNAAVELIRYEGRLNNLLLNRAPHTFLLNPDAQTVMNGLNPVDPSDPPCVPKDLEPENLWDLPGCPRLRAVDPSMTLLEIRRAGQRVGLLVFASVHPTVLRPNAALYSSDFTGQAVSALERVWHGTGEYPVVAFFNGAEGDVVARRTSRDLLDLARVSRRFAAAIEKTLATGPSHHEDLRIEVRHDDLLQARDATCPGEEAFRLSTDPTFGVASLGGGEGDRTILYELGWREEVVGRAEHGQGPKLPGLDSSVFRGINLTNIFARSWKYPAFLPLSHVRLGSLVLAAVPVEMTTRAGLLVRTELGDPDAARIVYGQSPNPGGDVERVRVIGLANDYSAYATSREEYMAQEYIGSSTMWGPDEAPFVACKLKALAGKPPSEGVQRRIAAKSYKAGWPPKNPFGPSFCGDERRFPDEENEHLFTKKDGAPDKSLPWFRWREPSLIADKKFLGWPPRRRVRILEQKVDVWVPRQVRPSANPTSPDEELLEFDAGEDDDLGFNIVTVLMDGSRAGHLDWAAVWTRPLRGPISGEFMFEVLLRDGDRKCSKPFQVRPGASAGEVSLGTCPHTRVPLE